MTKEAYDRLLRGLDELESTMSIIKSRITSCDNINIVLDSQIVGDLGSRIKAGIYTEELNNNEKDNLLMKHRELLTYFSDVQVAWETGCKCVKTNEEEKIRIRKNKIKEIFHRRSPEEMKQMTKQAIERIIVDSELEKGR